MARIQDESEVYIIPNPFEHSLILGNMLRELGDVRCGELTLFDDSRSVEEFMIEMRVNNILLKLNGPKEPKTDEELLDELISYTIASKSVVDEMEVDSQVEEKLESLITQMGRRVSHDLERVRFDPRPIEIKSVNGTLHLIMTEAALTFIRKDVYVNLQPVLYDTRLTCPERCTEQDLEHHVKSLEFIQNAIEDTDGVDEGQLDANSFYPHSTPERMIDHYANVVNDFIDGYNDPKSLFFSENLFMLANSEQLGCSCGMHPEDCVGSLIRYIASELAHTVN